MDEYDRIMAVDLRGVLLGTKHGINTMVPTGGGVIVNWSSIGGMNGSEMPTSIVLGGEGGRHRVHQGRRDRVRHPGHPRQRDLPGLHRDRDVGRTGRGGAVPRPREGHRAEAGRSTGRGRGARGVPRVRSRERTSPVPSSPSTAARPHGCRDDRQRHQRLLRPVRRRHQRRSVSDVPAPPRRSADLLQRALRRLGAVASRRRREGRSSTGRRSPTRAATSSRSSSRGWSCRRASCCSRTRRCTRCTAA